MLREMLSDLLAERQRLIDAIDRCNSAVGSIQTDDNKYPDFGVPIDGIGFSIGTIHARANLVVSLTADLGNINVDRLSSLPTFSFSRLRDEVRAAANELMSIVDETENFGKFATGDDTGLIYTNSDNSAALNLQEKYAAVASHLDVALSDAYAIRSLLDGSAPPDFSEAVVKLGETLGELSNIEFNGNAASEKIESILQEAKEKLAAIQESAKNIEEQLAATLQKRNEVDEETRNLHESAQTSNEKSQQLLHSVSEINALAATLKTDVDEYQQSFSEFGERLNTRNHEFDAGSTKLANLIDELNQKSQFADSVIRNAKEALGWGTVQSLTQSFSTSADELQRPTQVATVMVFVSLLVLSVWHL